MTFDPELAAIRFGCGLSPDWAPPADATTMLAALRGADDAAKQFPIDGMEVALAGAETYARLQKQWRQSGRGAQDPAVDKAYKAYRRKHLQQRHIWFGQALLRQTTSEHTLRERLVLFWADHFTARGKTAMLRPLSYPYVESAIRPFVTGRFEDLLIAVVTSPLMLHYLDQAHSIGPNSPAAARRRRGGGLNENLAREVLELHTLGVDGPYGQQDVRQLAELFTGLSFNRRKGFVFRKGQAEPGSETVLGASYGGRSAALAPILQVLRDLAMQPATARHLAWKLAVHFTRDDPAPDLVAALAESYLHSGGDLMVVYETLLQHLAAWQPALENIKPPHDFITSACRALGMRRANLEGWSAKKIQKVFVAPHALMGQPWQAPAGPDGWPEEDRAWITPQGISARLHWAMAAPQIIWPKLPDPVDFAQRSLGRRMNETINFVAGAAETRAEAIGLVLTAPAFQRR